MDVPSGDILCSGVGMEAAEVTVSPGGSCLY